MKRSLLLPILLLLLVSCKKKDIAEKLYNINFDVSGFTQKIDPISSTRSGGKLSVIPEDTSPSYFDNDPSLPISHVYLLIYKNNVLFKQIHQLKGVADFGKITETIPEGTYKMVFLASADTLVVKQLIGYDNPVLVLGDPGTDVFYKTIDLSVSGQINKTIALERIVTLLQIKLEDIIPISVKAIRIQPFIDDRYDHIDNHFDLFKGSLSGGSSRIDYDAYKIMRESEYGKPLTLNLYLGDIPKSGIIGVRVIAYDSMDDELAKVTIREIYMKKGYKTTLSGTLLDKTTGEGFKITIPNNAWTSAGAVINF
jgi:hypothetical protein